MRKFYTMLMAASAAYARWDIETSLSILKDSRKILLLIGMVLPVMCVSLAVATDSMPDILGGTQTYGPIVSTPRIFCFSIAIGLCAGLITGCIGAGGGFIITPALMSIGVKGIFAVGTDLFHIFAKAIMGTIVHKKLGNVNARLALCFLAGSTIGVSIGGLINRTLYKIDPALSDIFISTLYVVLLGFLGIYAMIDFLKLRSESNKYGYYEPLLGSEKSLAVSLQSVSLPPMITFDEDLTLGGKQISGAFVAACGVVVGFLAAIMGVGGGFLTFPMFIYVLGVSSFTTVGTDILQIIFTAGYASVTQYAVYGFIFYTLALGMLIGSLIGIQIGALTTRAVKGVYIRGFYATAILAGFINRLFDLPLKMCAMDMFRLSEETSLALTHVGNYIFYCVVMIFSIWVFSTFIKNINKLKDA